MLDLDGRAERLDKAAKLTKAMPFEPDFVLLYALLRACGLHLSLEIGTYALEGIQELEKDLVARPRDSAIEESKTNNKSSEDAGEAGRTKLKFSIPDSARVDDNGYVLRIDLIRAFPCTDYSSDPNDQPATGTTSKKTPSHIERFAVATTSAHSAATPQW